MSERKINYAAFFHDELQALAAARGLFAEVYELLRARGHEVEVRFECGEKEVPQIGTLDGFVVHNGGWEPVIKFGYTSDTSYSWKKADYWLVVEFEPGWAGRGTKVPGQDKLVKIVRDPKRTPNRMTPEAIADFVTTYVGRVRKCAEANDERRQRDAERELRNKDRESRAKALRDRQGAGRAYVYANRDSSSGELYVSFCGSDAEVARALALLDAEFPKS